MPRYGYGRKRYGQYSKRSSYAAIARNVKRQLRTEAAVQAAIATQIGPRGSDNSISVFGADYKSASAAQRAMRRRMGFKGKGAYGPALAAVAGALGPLAVKYAKSKGGLVGTIGSGIGKMFGWGAYNTPTGDVVQTNQLVETGGSVAMPNQQSIQVNADEHTGDVVLHHTEFMQNITAECPANTTSSPFKVQTFSINPGLTSTFPFLSQLAQNYTMYQFEGLMFQYKPTSGESGNSSNALGKVILSTDYDANADPYINSVQMANADYAQSTKPSCGAVHGVETAPHQQALKMMYVRNGTTTRDKIFTDLGLFQVASEGIPFASSTSAQSTQLGELWVTYKIRLSRANLFSSLLGANIVSDHLLAGYSMTTGWAQPLRRKESTLAIELNRGVFTTPNPVPQTNNTPGGWTNCPQLIITFPQNISLGYYRVLVQLNAIGPNMDANQLYIRDSANLKFFRPGTEGYSGTGDYPADYNLGPVAVAGANIRSDQHYISLPKASQTLSLPYRNAIVAYIQVEAPGLSQASLTISLDGAAPVGGTASWQYIVDVTQVSVSNSIASQPVAITYSS